MRAVLCNAFEGIKALNLGEAVEPHPADCESREQITQTSNGGHGTMSQREHPIEVVTWEQIEPNRPKSRAEFHKQLDVERALEDIKQINCNVDRLVQYEKRVAANTGIIAIHLGLIACLIGVYVVVRILGTIFQ
jgi:hypothetical protein